jgi:hypothetical protein
MSERPLRRRLRRDVLSREQPIGATRSFVVHSPRPDGSAIGWGSSGLNNPSDAPSFPAGPPRRPAASPPRSTRPNTRRTFRHRKIRGSSSRPASGPGAADALRARFSVSARIAVTTPANVPDIKGLAPLFNAIPPVKGKPGRPRRRPDRMQVPPQVRSVHPLDDLTRLGHVPMPTSRSEVTSYLTAK